MDAPQCFVPAKLRQRDKNIKQGSSSELVENNEAVVALMRAQVEQACNLYQELLDKGVCPEQARTILPQSMYTEFIETASLAGYARLAILRLDGTAQKEIREYAQRVSDLVAERFPVSWKVLMSCGKTMLG
jgi:thymidylate synthase (FAD)